MTSTIASVQAAATGLPMSGPGDQRFRCASLLKPLLFWAATGLPAYRRDNGPWRAMAMPAVRLSANEPTEALWNECGGAVLLDALADRIGIGWQINPERDTFGGVLVTAQEVLDAYTALTDAAEAKEVRARFLISMMVRVPDRLTFGLRTVATATGHHRGNVAIKTGADLNADETIARTHAVTILWRPGHLSTIATVLTGLPLAPRGQADYQQNAEALACPHRRSLAVLGNCGPAGPQPVRGASVRTGQ
jgi:hypothetical protein